MHGRDVRAIDGLSEMGYIMARAKSSRQRG